MANPKGHLSTGQFARLCSVTPNAVLKWIKAGKLIALRTPGGHYRIQRDMVKSVLGEELPSVTRLMEGRPFLYCWDFNSVEGIIQEGCRECIVYRARSRRCYEVARSPNDAEHAKLFCKNSCDECSYYHLAKGQRPNVLVVTDKPELRASLSTRGRVSDYNLGFADCEYQCSMLIENYRPDYVILDCSMGSERSRDFARHLYADPRIQLVKTIMVGNRGQFPSGCDREVFAFVELPFTLETLDALRSDLERLN